MQLGKPENTIHIKVALIKLTAENAAEDVNHEKQSNIYYEFKHITQDTHTHKYIR